MREQWIRYGQGFLLAYSITSRLSFDKELKPLFGQLTRVRDVESLKDVPLVLFGNKLDLENSRQVTTEEGRELARQMGCTFFEGSAKTCVNLEEAFFQLVRQIRKQQEGSSEDSSRARNSGRRGGCSLF
eukprot:TRINITY_DN772_c0_g1_i10.p1 TRINITY_DN772_c0_g1~~TRINITY_DN772_c0_g1_i10.p1  ORF type:complete len:129 (-),score=19.73 TRINITY_DN772_c0_g1_i10:202-588(-)